MAPQTRELLETIMAGQLLTIDGLDNLLQNRVAEDLFLDYKHGNELQDRKKGSATIRQYLSGFANSAGGVLIIGVDEETWTVTGCTAPGGGDLAVWAASCLTPIASYFSPPPRFQVVKHPDGDILIAATERSLGLVPVIEGGEFIYYLRFHDQTLTYKTVKAPEYLIGDLILGRRQQPYLNITTVNIEDIIPDISSSFYVDVWFTLSFILENQNISWAEDVRIGCISWLRQRDQRPNLINNHLLSYLDVQLVNIQARGVEWGLSHLRHNIDRVEAFGAEDLHAITAHRINMRAYESWFNYTWKAGVYILSKSTPPIWYQLTLTVNNDFLQIAHNQLPRERLSLTMERLVGGRPIIACEPL